MKIGLILSVRNVERMVILEKAYRGLKLCAINVMRIKWKNLNLGRHYGDRKGKMKNNNSKHFSQKSELKKTKIAYCINNLRRYVYGNVVDMGAGTGNITDLLTKDNNKVKSVLCVDFSKYHKKILLKKKYKVRLIDLNKNKYNLKTSHFDTIISTDVIEHLYSPYIHLTELNRILKRSGVLIISTPDANKTKITQLHLNYFSYISFYKTLKRCGFNKIERIYNGIGNSFISNIVSRIPIVRNILTKGIYIIARKVKN